MTSKSLTIVAVEGGCNYGKSTLINELTRLLPNNLAVAPDYAVDAGQMPSSFFSPSGGTEERLSVVRFFSDIDARRSKYFIPGGRICLFDRSVYTLIAHSYAEEQLFGYEATDSTVNYLKARLDVHWPAIVIVIEVSPESIEERRSERSPPGLLANMNFDRYFRDFFKQSVLPNSPRLIRCHSPLSEGGIAEIASSIRESIGET